MTPTLFQLVVAARERFVRAGIPPDLAAIDAEVLARHLLAWDRATYLLRRDEPVSAADRARYDALVERRARREPVAYITGRREFWGREFVVSPAVLVPRPETEVLVEAVLTRLGDRSRPWRIADVGTGSGCLAVTLAAELPASRVVATDISVAALQVARTNAVRHGVDGRILMVRTSLLTGIAGPFDVVVANLPYIPRPCAEALSPDVRDYEPHEALFGQGEDGLDTIRELLVQTSSRLSADGLLLLEFGFGQGDAMRAELARTPLRLIDVLRDLQGHERTLVAAAPLTA
ncbi:MAG TPA: peptide chain release factor N(5)-glutamine methyltransferase [Vicinamibacterales bacterium]